MAPNTEDEEIIRYTFKGLKITTTSRRFTNPVCAMFRTFDGYVE